jgi:GTPase
MGHKAGFVNIVGNPNVGKSTLMNALVGERISVITSKAQTTRHRITGIVNGDDFQIVYSDTPGVLEPNYKLQQAMLGFSSSALIDADVLVYVTDTVEDMFKHPEFVAKVQQITVPLFVVINKVDLSNSEKVDVLFDKIRKAFPNAEIFPLSALHKFNLEFLLKRIVDLLPESPPYFEKDSITDRSERFFVTEIIRGKILEQYKKEVPYSTEVVVESFKEEGDFVEISAIINVERDSQKGIIIGHKGEALKKIGIAARKDIEQFLEKRIMLKLFVKVEKNWRNNDNTLKKFGYRSE